ncbi:unnamed protein product [Rhizoctonia solani]|uniref:Uncharacterized protein n=1 Tax=Rhizoctonia solani TaxID=456999 RepID=A0A8H3C3Y8_9AGAM|nr:unnamed protein product [Rhizoctonia solani]
MSTVLFDYIQAIKPSLDDEKRAKVALLASYALHHTRETSMPVCFVPYRCRGVHTPQQVVEGCPPPRNPRYGCSGGYDHPTKTRRDSAHSGRNTSMNLVRDIVVDAINRRTSTSKPPLGPWEDARWIGVSRDSIRTFMPKPVPKVEFDQSGLEDLDTECALELQEPTAVSAFLGRPLITQDNLLLGKALPNIEHGKSYPDADVCITLPAGYAHVESSKIQIRLTKSEILVVADAYGRANVPRAVGATVSTSVSNPVRMTKKTFDHLSMFPSSGSRSSIDKLSGIYRPSPDWILQGYFSLVRAMNAVGTGIMLIVNGRSLFVQRIPFRFSQPTLHTLGRAECSPWKQSVAQVKTLNSP